MAVERNHRVLTRLYMNLSRNQSEKAIDVSGARLRISLVSMTIVDPVLLTEEEKIAQTQESVMHTEIEILRRGLEVMLENPTDLHRWGAEEDGYMTLSVYLSAVLVVLSFLPRGDLRQMKNRYL